MFSHSCLCHFSANTPFLLKMSWAIVLLPTQSISYLLQLFVTPERERHRENIFCLLLCVLFLETRPFQAVMVGDFVCFPQGYPFIGYSSALSLSSPSTHRRCIKAPCSFLKSTKIENSLSSTPITNAGIPKVRIHSTHRTILHCIFIFLSLHSLTGSALF